MRPLRSVYVLLACFMLVSTLSWTRSRRALEGPDANLDASVIVSSDLAELSVSGGGSKAVARDDASSGLTTTTTTTTVTKQFPKQVYFLKIPKCGGTTLAVILQAYAKANNLVIASPGLSRTVDTCQEPAKAMRAWEKMANNTGGSFDMMISHGCFRMFMISDKKAHFWGHSKSLAVPSLASSARNMLKVTLFRDPWDRFVSFYRYVLKCCSLETPHEWCKLQCGWAKDFTKFAHHNCNWNEPYCNQLHYYLKAQYPRERISPEAANEILKPFDLVLTLDLLDEGLILLHLKYGLPFRFLPYVVSNTNLDVPPPKYTEDEKKILSQAMQPDKLIYSIARRNLQKEIDAYSKEVFNDLLSKLRALNAKAKVSCANRWNRCLTNDPSIVSYTSCFYECVEAIADGLETLPEVTVCETNKCPTGKFRRSCYECSCNPDNTASCTSSCASQPTPDAASIITEKCL